MRTRRASYSPEASTVTTHDHHESSPKRRKLDSSSRLPASVLEEHQFTESESGDHDNEASDSETEDEDELIERLLQQAEQNLNTNTSLTEDKIILPSTTQSQVLNKGNQKQNTLLTTSLESSMIVTPENTSIKRLTAPSSKQQKQKEKASTAGEKWFDLPATEMTPQIKRDLLLLQMRDVLDPKRFYRASSKTLPKYFQMGTIIEGPTEFFGRIKKKDRKETIVQELLADQQSREYFKRKYNEIQEKSTSGGKKWYKLQQERKNNRK